MPLSLSSKCLNSLDLLVIMESQIGYRWVVSASSQVRICRQVCRGGQPKPEKKPNHNIVLTSGKTRVAATCSNALGYISTCVPGRQWADARKSVGEPRNYLQEVAPLQVMGRLLTPAANCSHFNLITMWQLLASDGPWTQTVTSSLLSELRR